MNSPLAAAQRGHLLEAALPDIAFDGWSYRALHAAAARIGIAPAEAAALFPGGAAEMVAAFSRWADGRLFDRLEAAPLDGLGVAARIALALRLRLEVLAPWREAVRRGLSVLALPSNAPLGCRLLYETADGIWYAVGDTATDFSFYTKRATLAGVHAASQLYWLDDRSPGFADTLGFIERRLASLHRLSGLRRRIEAAAERLPDPLRMLRPLR